MAGCCGTREIWIGLERRRLQAADLFAPFSPDGRYLAVVFSADVAASGPPAQTRVWVVDTATRRLRAVPGAVMCGAESRLAIT
jgi:hypothetical protein